MPNVRQHSIVTTVREGCYWVARLWFRGVFYHRTLRGRRPRTLILIPEENWPGNSDRGAHLVDGQFRFFHYSLDAATALTGRNDAGRIWQASLHDFNWLRDLRAVGGDAARIQARNYIIDWILANSKWHPLAWQPDVLSSRLCNWFTHGEFLSIGADESFARAFLESTARQVKHLRRAARFITTGLERMLVLKALVYAALCLPGGIGNIPILLKRISLMCEQQILPDGGHIERSPVAQFMALYHLVDIKEILEKAGITIPEELQAAIDRAAPMLRFYRHGDGAFALFNGSTEGEPGLVDIILAKAAAGGKPPASAAETGFERIVANRTLLIVDSGTPTKTAADAHAGSLSFEMSIGKQRVIVNCGAYAGRDEVWRLAQRATAAHSTLIVDHRNSTEISPDGSVGVTPAIVTCERREQDGNTWLDLTHDGYRHSHGLVHRRRIYVNTSGTDVRGDDTLEGSGEHKFAIRLHLHPSVKASLVKDGASVLLRLPDRSGWRFRCSGGVASLQESVYLGNGQGSRRSEQIVISAATRQGNTQVKWALARLTEK
ncbi:MAG: heparinase II/III family protein [Pseudomonadota bacterium]|nr:heparinase II/III family protein [Pseudomonadota bacterium]